MKFVEKAINSIYRKKKIASFRDMHHKNGLKLLLTMLKDSCGWGQNKCLLLKFYLKCWMLEKILINHIEETLQAQMLQLIKCYENTTNHTTEIAWRSAACDLETQHGCLLIAQHNAQDGILMFVCVCIPEWNMPASRVCDVTAASPSSMNVLMSLCTLVSNWVMAEMVASPVLQHCTAWHRRSTVTWEE